MAANVSLAASDARLLDCDRRAKTAAGIGGPAFGGRRLVADRLSPVRPAPARGGGARSLAVAMVAGLRLARSWQRCRCGPARSRQSVVDIENDCRELVYRVASGARSL